MLGAAVSSFAWGPAAAAETGDLGAKIRSLKARYNAAIDPINAAMSGNLDRRKYTVISLERLTLDYPIGTANLSDLARLGGLPHPGRRLAVRGQLVRRDVEELRGAGAVYRLYRIEPRAKPAGMWSVAVDIVGLPRRARSLIDDLCGLAFACDVTLYGRVDEVVAERVVKFFSDGGDTAVTIGLVADRAEFHPIAP